MSDAGFRVTALTVDQDLIGQWRIKVRWETPFARMVDHVAPDRRGRFELLKTFSDVHLPHAVQDVLRAAFHAVAGDGPAASIDLQHPRSDARLAFCTRARDVAATMLGLP